MKNKIQTIFECSKCGAQSSKWAGRCLECGAWGTLEENISSGKKSNRNNNVVTGKVIDFSKVVGQDFSRIKTGINELDQVLGGGIVAGSLILLGGEPGIGKSTIVAQLAATLKKDTLYVSGEESAEQIKMRLDRLKLNTDSLKFLGETNIDIICRTIEELKPNIAIIDSIQTMATAELPSEAGNVSQVRACTVKLLEVAKKNNIPIFVIGHVTKDGQVAGPKTLEHLVDTVLYLEGDRFHTYRLLRTVKNRFGSTDEVGIFEMTKTGLSEVSNPSLLFLEEKNENIAGSVTTCVMEGTRPLLLEIQSLVSKTYFGYPQRRATGFDLNRLQLLIAVLDKRAKINLGMHDVHLNVAGGYKIQEPACDLAVALAVGSAFKNKTIAKDIIIFGEIGLGGEIRSTAQAEKRINEAEKMGFNEIITPTFKRHGSNKIKVTMMKNLEEVLQYLEI